MSYRLQIQADFNWRLGHSADGNAPWRLVEQGVGSSQADATTKALAAKARDQADRDPANKVLIFDQTQPD
jgi:hypothetical protein